MEIISEFFSTIWDVWKQIWKMIWGILPKAISFILWLLSGVIILPCVFVAGVLFPMWSDWGEEF